MKKEGIVKQVYNIIWPKLSYIKLKLNLLKPANRACLKSIANQCCANSFDTEQSRINFIRNWVNSNSIHLIDAEHDRYAFNVPEVLNRLNAYALGEGKKPHLSCGPRAYAMKAILDFMGIQSRIIDLFGLTEMKGGKLKVSPHTLIEVEESDTQKWILHDPDFNVAYAKLNTNEYQSAQEMLRLPPEEKGYDTAGYKIENLLNLQNTVKGLFEWGVLYRHSYDGRCSELALIHKKQRLEQMVSSDRNLLSFIQERAYRITITLIDN